MLRLCHPSANIITSERHEKNLRNDQNYQVMVHSLEVITNHI